MNSETGEVGAMGVLMVGVFSGDEDGARDVGVSLVGVERNGLPPVGDGGVRGCTAVGGGDGEEEIFDQEGLGRGPLAVPNKVNVDRRRKNRAHMVSEVDKVRRAFEFLGGGEDFRWEFWVKKGVIFLNCMERL